MTEERRVLVHPDKPALAGSVAARFITVLIDTIDRFGEASIILTGGTMGSAVLAAVNSSAARDSIDWSKVQFWWGDERWLPRGHADRNETQSRAALLDHLPLDASQVHAFPASDEGIELDAAAVMFAQELADQAAEGRPYPRFDVTFLGVGPDGHIASLFPDRPGLREVEATVVAVRNSPKPPPERLSLTLPVINSSDQVWLVMAGSDKASALGLTLAGASINEVPAAGVEGRTSTLFFVDAEATAEVPESLIATDLFWTSADSSDPE